MRRGRRLAAIMFTDMVGYSSLSQLDESLAIKLLGEHRRLLRDAFQDYGGHEMDVTGDGFLVEFASALEAVRCGVHIQRMLRDRNAAAKPERSIVIRVGIHLGDVEFSEDNVYGNGVNIAARIEPLAEPGGICISQQIFDQVHNRIDLPLVSIGTPSLKNIRSPIEIYRVELPWLKAAPKPQAARMDRPLPARIPPADRKSIAVLPLTNLSPDVENEYFSDGLTEDILTQLSKIRGLKVISRTSAMQYKKTPKNVKDIGRELGVSTILEGSVRKAGNKVRISVQLIDASNDEHLWGETYDRELADIFAIQTDVAKQITDALKAHVSPDEQSRIEHWPTHNLDAYQAYLKGRFLWNERTKESVTGAIEEFKRAIELDPGFAPAHVGLAESYIVLDNFGTFRPSDVYPAAKAAALRALQIDPTLGEAYASLAQVKMVYDWDWDGAEEAYLKAIELRPSYATAHQWYALYLSAVGRFDESIEEITRAQDLDPLSLSIINSVAMAHLWARRYDQAINAIKGTLEMNPRFPSAHWYLGGIRMAMGSYADALPPLQEAERLSSGSTVAISACLAHVYARLGERAEAMKIVTRLTDDYRKSYASPVWIALVYLGLGDRTEALQWLARAREDRDGWLRMLKTVPFFDEIRDTAEYQDLLRTIGLAER